MEESVALRSYFQAHKQEMIDTLAAWVAVPSVRGDAKPGMSYGAEPARMLKLALEQCAALGFQTESVANCMGSVELMICLPHWLYCVIWMWYRQGRAGVRIPLC